MKNSRNCRKTLRRLGHTIFHPFAGFGDCVEENFFPVSHGLFVLILFFLCTIASQQWTGFLFNYTNPESLNILLIFAKTVILFFIWCGANWAITTLFEGKGSFRQIFYVSSVSLVPYVTVLLLNTLLSNLVTPDEGTFLSILKWAGILLSVFVLLAALMTIHDYTLEKVIVSTLFSLIFIIIILFLAIIVFSLFQQAFGFFKDVFNELTFML